MRLSEAIRLGAAMKPQAFGSLHYNGGTCAMGAVCDALGIDYNCMKLPGEMVDFIESMQKCPACGKVQVVYSVITHLNDMHRWTRERIADFVELHEGVAALAPAPECEEARS